MTQNNLSYVPDSENTANDSAMSLALRQLRAILGGPLFWIVNGSAVVLTALAGPYYTLERLSFAERLVYWGTTIMASALIMTFLSILAFRLSESRGWNWALAAGAAGAVGVLPVVCSVYLAEGIVVGFEKRWIADQPFWHMLMLTAPSVIAVTLLVNTVIRYQSTEQDAKDAAPGPASLSPTILQGKLPHHLGHDIVSVRAQDHYVEVTTPLGSAMVLMRLSDAITDLAPLNGLQVHRSWWVSLSHVTRREKGPNGPELILSSDQSVPVGRSFRQAFRAATDTTGS